MAAKAMVICYYCHEKFDKNSEPYYYIEKSKRYAHQACADKFLPPQLQEEKDYEALTQYLEKLFNKDYVTAQVKRQITQYKKEYHYTLDGIRASLKWWYEVQKNTVNEDNEHYGIAIVPYIYDKAKAYYTHLNVAKENNAEVDLTAPMKVINVEIDPPTVTVTPPRLFKIE